jgi:hypothetical protein
MLNTFRLRRIDSSVRCFLHGESKELRMGQGLIRILTVAVVAVLLVCTLTGVVLACSGPKAGELIEHNRSIVNVYGGVAVFLLLGIVAVYFLRGRKGIFAALLGLMVGYLHPVWRYGAGSPDCGKSIVEGAQNITMILAGILIVQAAVWHIQRRRIIAKRT